MNKKYCCKNCKFCEIDSSDYTLDYRCKIDYSVILNRNTIPTMCQIISKINRDILSKFKDKRYKYRLKQQHFNIIYDYFVKHKESYTNLLLEGIVYDNGYLQLCWGERDKKFIVMRFYDKDGSIWLKYMENNKTIDEYHVRSFKYNLIFIVLLRNYFSLIYKNNGIDYLLENKKYKIYLDKYFKYKKDE